MYWKLALLGLLAQLSAGAPVPRITVENSDPQLASFAKAVIPLCEQWYPKIAEILYGSNQPNPPAEIRIVFGQNNLTGSAEGNVIHLSAAEAKRPAKLDFRAVVIHELVHVVQSYPQNARCDGLRMLGCLVTRGYYSPAWANEGIADYVTYTFFAGTNKPLLQVNADGQLYGYDESIPYLYGLQQAKISLNAASAQRGVQSGKGYQHGYTVTASFFLWLEINKDKQIIRKLNHAMKTKAYRDSFWQQICGASIDKLWAEFLSASMRPSG